VSKDTTVSSAAPLLFVLGHCPHTARRSIARPDGTGRRRRTGHPVPTGGTLDLRDATLDPAGATLRASALFGGGNLIVPEGVAMFGGWGITSEPADEEELGGAYA